MDKTKVNRPTQRRPMKKNKTSVRSIETYLVHVVRVVEWNYPPGSSGVVLVSCDARQPPLQHLISDLLRVDPSGVVKTRVQPHRVVTSLNRLDAPPKEDFQQVHASHTLADKLNHSTDQHLDLRLFLRRHFQRGGFLCSIQRKRGKPCRLSCGHLVCTVKPSRVPPTD